MSSGRPFRHIEFADIFVVVILLVPTVITPVSVIVASPDIAVDVGLFNELPIIKFPLLIFSTFAKVTFVSTIFDVVIELSE